MSPQSGAPATEAVVRDAVVEVVTEILPNLSAADIRPDRNLAELGADSVDRVEILAMLTHRLGRSDEVSAFADLPDIGALVTHLSEGGAR